MEDKKIKPESPAKPEMCKMGELFQFLQGSDRCLLFVGTLAALTGGLSMPAFVFFFGKLTDSFDPATEAEETLNEITRLSKIFLIIGAIIWVLGIKIY